MVGIVIYIAWRFEFIFGIGAAIATFHDVLAVLGIFWLLNMEITLLVVTALLTLAGYSLTDTVVVFDRIRENLARKRGKLGDIINLSVNEVLSRTIVTSSTVFLVVLALFFFGGVVLTGLRPGHDPGGPGGHLLLGLRGQPHRLRLAQRGQTGGGETGKGRRTGGPETETGREEGRQSRRHQEERREEVGGERRRVLGGGPGMQVAPRLPSNCPPNPIDWWHRRPACA